MRRYRLGYANGQVVLQNQKIYTREIKDTKKSKGFFVSTGNRRFPLDF